MSFFKVFMQKQEGLTNREITCAVFVTPQFIYMCILSEAVAQRCSVKKVFLEISQKSQENTCARVSFLITLQAETTGGCFCYFDFINPFQSNVLFHSKTSEVLSFLLILLKRNFNLSF